MRAISQLLFGIPAMLLVVAGILPVAYGLFLADRGELTVNAFAVLAGVSTVPWILCRVLPMLVHRAWWRGAARQLDLERVPLKRPYTTPSGRRSPIDRRAVQLLGRQGRADGGGGAYRAAGGQLLRVEIVHGAAMVGVRPQFALSGRIATWTMCGVRFERPLGFGEALHIAFSPAQPIRSQVDLRDLAADASSRLTALQDVVRGRVPDGWLVQLGDRGLELVFDDHPRDAEELRRVLAVAVEAARVISRWSPPDPRR